MLFRPKAQRDRRQFIYNRNCIAVLRQIDGLDVMMAAIAGFNANVLELVSSVNYQLLDVFFPARGAQQPPEFPFVRTKTANERTLSPISLRPKDPGLRPTPTNGAERLNAAGCRFLRVIGEKFRVRL